MARGIFNPEGEFLRELHKKKLEEAKNEPPETDEEPEKESPEEKEAREKAEARYEARVDKKPVKIETGEQVARYLGEEIERTADERTWDKTEVYRGERSLRRGHRHGEKAEKHDRETIRQKKAA